MEWLGDNTSDDRKLRSYEDNQRLRQILCDVDADILAVQEVEHEQALQRVLIDSSKVKHPDAAKLLHYAFVLGNTGGKQRIGFLYRFPVQLLWVQEVLGIAVEEGRTRAGLLAMFRVDTIQWLVLAVHLKSSSRSDSTQELRRRSISIRAAQAAYVRHLTDSLCTHMPSVPFVILGDFNDTPRRRHTTLDTLQSSPHLTFLTLDQTSCAFSGLPSIDHIVVSHAALQRFMRGTLRTINTYAMLPEHAARQISDHCPIVAQFSIQ
ncbi:MAG: endonuclease/exonuclease/phosphatase family protein [Bacteroidota bacterium]|nr:endonuclease/exonuclease/phosphatase family protein [Candidatus Kapabacteria bacterium]MDW8221165.1 endonuclease/exonuclease/phosphatase family protein [Bacteroidota bacterium]